jgi:hypothetical protein
MKHVPLEFFFFTQRKLVVKFSKFLLSLKTKINPLPAEIVFQHGARLFMLTKRINSKKLYLFLYFSRLQQTRCSI